MKLTSLGIEGAWLAESPMLIDERGFFREWFKAADVFASTGVEFDIQQANISQSQRGVIRGIHYSLAPQGQAKWITCASGHVLDVIVDIRPNSATFKKVVQVDLRGGEARALLIGTGLGHGFLALEDNSVLTYLLSSQYAPQDEYEINPMDSDLKIDWRLGLVGGSGLIISAKDSQSSIAIRANGSGKIAAMMLEKLPDKTKSRMHSLDGLRGVAALIVVVHHLLLTLPWFADRVGLGQLGAKGQFIFSWHNLFEYTPLHILYGGTEAVVIFFVLSGFVLINPVNKQSLVTYTRNRLVRLYAPIIAAVLLAGGLVKVMPHQKMDGASWWLNSHAIPFTFGALFRNMWVLDGADWLNSSLWSMRYEVIFSLCVMVFAGFVFKKSTSHFIRAIIIIVLTTWIGMDFGLDLLSWLPVFFAGSALHWLDEDKFLSSGLKAIIGWFVMFVPWYFAGFGYSLSTSVQRICMILGAVLIVDACRHQGSVVSKVLQTRPFKLAGRYSYSLYLVHVPILTSVWFVMGVTESYIGWLLRAGISILFIGLGTVLVYAVAEKPSLKWIHSKS